MTNKVYKKFNTTSDFNSLLNFEFKLDRGNGNVIMRQVANHDINEYIDLVGGSVVALQYVQGVAQLVINTVGGDKQLDKASLLQEDLKAFFDLEPQILSKLPEIKDLLEMDK